MISPGDTYTEVEEKVLEWLEAGARMVVVVNPRKHAVTVYRSLTDIVVLTVSMDLPFAQNRFCAAQHADKITTLSDHREALVGRRRRGSRDPPYHSCRQG